LTILSGTVYPIFYSFIDEHISYYNKATLSNQLPIIDPHVALRATPSNE